MSKVEAVNQLTKVLGNLFKEYNLSTEEVLIALKDRKQGNLPLSVFSNTKLSVLEIVVKFYRENKKKRYSEIAKLLNRDDRTIWTTYKKSTEKSKEPLVEKGDALVPVSIFSGRKKSVLESLVIFLKDSGYSFNKIASLLKKDYQTVYTTYRRGIAKNE